MNVKILSDEINNSMAGSSMIRKMFEKGIELKKQFGAENVFDFSLGNPDLPSPAEAVEVMRGLAENAGKPLAFGYCPNAGMPAVREAVASAVSEEQAVKVDAKHIVMTVGAAGGIVSFFRAVLEPGDEVVCPSPYFVEYAAYCGHFGGKLKPVKMAPPEFSLDTDAIMAEVGDKTRVVLVNNPNNPTGAVYPADELKKLGAALAALNAKRERPVYLLSDEPYRALRYDGAEVAPILSITPFSVVIGSYSKTLSLAGERIGYIAVNPAMPEAEKLASAVALTLRTLGFVNAPVIGQKLVAALCRKTVDAAVYQRRRDAMVKVLSDAGLKFNVPRGAFYIFIETPGGDDKAFVDHLASENILAVPGSGFGFSGYMRIAFCVDEKIISASAPAFKRAMASWK